jgi:hypothetical protein
LAVCRDSPPRLSHPTSNSHLPFTASIEFVFSLSGNALKFFVGWDKVAGGATLVCHSMLNVAAHEVPRERRPTNGLERTFGLSVAAGVESTNGGGPARGGICLFSGSNLLHSEYLAWRFASILRPACPTLRVVAIDRSRLQSSSSSPFSTMRWNSSWCGA